MKKLRQREEDRGVHDDFSLYLRSNEWCNAFPNGWRQNSCCWSFDILPLHPYMHAWNHDSTSDSRTNTFFFQQQQKMCTYNKKSESHFHGFQLPSTPKRKAITRTEPHYTRQDSQARRKQSLVAVTSERYLLFCPVARRYISPDLRHIERANRKFDRRAASTFMDKVRD